MSLETSPALRGEIHPISDSEQIPCSRVEGEMELGQGDLPAEIADTTLSLDDGAKPCEVDCDSPPVIVCGRILRHLTESQCDRTSSQDLASEGVKSRGTRKVDKPIAQRTRSKLKLQLPPKARKENDILDKADTEVRELLLQLLAQNKEQQKKIKEMELMLKKVLAVQTSIVDKLHGNAAGMTLQSDSKGEPTQTSIAEEMVKPFTPKAKWGEKPMLPTTSLDGSDVSSQCDSDISPCNPARVFMVTTPRKKYESTSVSPEGSENIFGSPTDSLIERLEIELDELREKLREGLKREHALGKCDAYDSRSKSDASQSTSASEDTMQSDTSSTPVRSTRRRFIFPQASKKDRKEAYKRLADAMSKVPDKVHLDKKGKRKTATLYMGNLEYNASADDIFHALNEEFLKVRVEDVTIPRLNGKSLGYGFVKISWAYNAPISMKDTCIYRTGNVFVNSRPIYFRELNDKAGTSSSRAAKARALSATTTSSGMRPMRMYKLSDGGVYVC
jgi:hypothetical protein